MDIRVFLVTAPPLNAENIARALVERNLAACVNIVPGIRSIYRWEGKICEDDEFLLIIKTASDRVSELINTIKEIHPYTVPEVISMGVVEGYKGYIEWVIAETRQGSKEGEGQQ